MDTDAPLNRLVLTAQSVADDLGFVALGDLCRLLGIEANPCYRVIGGHMVTALAARWQLGSALYRETGDTDLGAPPLVINDRCIVEGLMDLGYERLAGNRFARTMSDIPVRVIDEPGLARKAIVDILVPAYTSRPRENLRVGKGLVTIEVPGLATALVRPPVLLSLELHRLNGERLDIELSFPDEVAALLLKALATRHRSKATDVVDVWRCLEVANAAGVRPDAFRDAPLARGAEIVHGLFSQRHGPGMEALVEEQRLSHRAADERFTRTRALIERVVGTAWRI